MKNEIRIYNKEYGDYDFFEAVLLIPTFCFKKQTQNILGELYSNYELGFDTGVRYYNESDDSYWSFSIQFLGFGARIHRQSGY